MFMISGRFKLPYNYLRKLHLFKINPEVTLRAVKRNQRRGIMSENGSNKETNSKEENPQGNIKDLSKFLFSRILSSDSQKKIVFVEGSFSDKEGKAVLILEKTPLNEETVKSLNTEKSTLQRKFLNDVFGSYSCFPDPLLNDIKTTLIFPASDQYISKFLSKELYLIEETAELYDTITLPFILKEQFDVQWVYNVLDHKKEKDRIVFEDPDETVGFILLPDLKWNGNQTEDLYMLALVRCRGIKSLRDLSSEHLPLLRNILKKGKQAIKDIYSIPLAQLRVYLHYQPTFYHLHIHFNYLKHEAPGIHCEKSHLLTTVINNIELQSDYYQKASLTFVGKEGEGLGKEYISKGIIEPVEKKD